MSDEKFKWYVLRAISGKEAKVKEVLDAAIKNTPLGENVRQVLIPTENVYATRNGKKVSRERTLYSGYVFVNANLTGEVQYELKNTTNVIDFLRGRAKTSAPVSLSEDDVMRMLKVVDNLQEPTAAEEETLLVGEPVKVSDGSFSGFTGIVKSINAENHTVKVEVKIFGKPTDLELEISQVEKEV